MPRTPRRTRTKLLRLHPEELARITARARACGQTPAGFIRETALGSIPKARHDAAADPLLAELARVGRSLHQLARVAETGRHTGLVEQVRAALDRHWTLVRQVAQARRQRAPQSAR